MSPSLSTQIRRGLVVSAVLHGIVVLVGWLTLERDRRPVTGDGDAVDIELAPPAPHAEALPAETARQFKEEAPKPTPVAEATPAPPPQEPGTGPVDAGVDAPPDAPPDAALVFATALDATPPDASVVPVDAAEPDAPEAVAVGSGSGSGSAATEDKPRENAPAVAGTLTSPGTAANLLRYFPSGHNVTVLIRWDRLRGTEWSQPTERLFHPMPDYKQLFGKGDAGLVDKLDMLVISTPEAHDPVVTTLVGKTRLGRSALRDFLGKAAPVIWSPAKGGLLGKRTKGPARDKRMFLSPFKSWFVFATPDGLSGGITEPSAAADIDTIETQVPLPGWLAGIRSIEGESGLTAGPALIVTIALEGARYDMGDNDYGLGVSQFPTPRRISVAATIDPQGWIVKGNMKFGSAAEATEFVTKATQAQERVHDSTIIQRLIGDAAGHVVANLSLAQTDDRVSYATSVSIADMRTIMQIAAVMLDDYFARIH